ncbi:putative glycoside hydrolase [Pyrococcus kukulkanii]|uniref:Glycoside hydrolase n=1 Tax=Pyrococcus kukulkanii TaxID=1609559 RepID=A0ABV4T2Z4_9EURY
MSTRKVLGVLIVLIFGLSILQPHYVLAENKGNEEKIVGVWMWPSTYRGYYEKALESFGYRDPFNVTVYPNIPKEIREKALNIAAKQLIQELKNAGITDIFLEVKLTTGYLIYPSKAYPERTYPSYPYNDTNILIPLLKEAHKNGIRVHAWIIVHYDKDFFGKIDPIWHVGKAKYNWKPTPIPGRVRLANKEYLKVLEQISKELISMGFDGIHLDYIRYPHMVYSFSPADIKRAQEYGINVTKVIFAVRHTFYDDVPLQNGSVAGPRDPYYIFKLYLKRDPDIVKWFELRRKDVDSYVGNITKFVHSLKTWNNKVPIVSAALMPDLTRDNILYPKEFQLLHYGQVWSDFVKLGVDWLIPMAYYRDYGEPVKWVGIVKSHVINAAGNVSVPLVGVQTYSVSWEDILNEERYVFSELGDKKAVIIPLPDDIPSDPNIAEKVIDTLTIINKELYKRNIEGYMTLEILDINGTTIPKGSLIIVGEKAILDNILLQIPMKTIEINKLPKIQVIPLIPPKIAILDVGSEYTIHEVLKELGFQYDIIPAEKIKEGELKKYDILVLPPGSGTWEAKLLGKEGSVKVSEFIAGGGGLIGICAGGYAVIKGYNEPTSEIQLVDARLKNWPKWWLGVGIVNVKVINQSNPVTFGFKDSFRAIYWNGPVFEPYDLKANTTLGLDVAPYVELVKYISTEDTEGAFSYGWGDFNKTYVDSIMKNAPAVIFSKYGEGKILLFSFHPELTSGDTEYAPNSILDSRYNYRLLFNAVYFVSRKSGEITLEPGKGIIYFRWATYKSRLNSPDVSIKVHAQGAILTVKVINYGNVEAKNVTVDIVLTLNNTEKVLDVSRTLETLSPGEVKYETIILGPSLLTSRIGLHKIKVTASVKAENEVSLTISNNKVEKEYLIMVFPQTPIVLFVPS